MTKVNANIDTQVNVKPAKSQVVLVTLIILSTICFLIGFAFLWHKPNFAWVPLSIACIILLAVFYGWHQSHRDVDLADSTPTKFTDVKGNSITTDTRALTSPQAVHNIERIFSGICHREPLPEPDGLINENGKPISNSVDEAKERVREANEMAQKITNTVVSSLNIDENVEEFSQPLIDEPKSEIVIATNIGGEQA